MNPTTGDELHARATSDGGDGSLRDVQPGAGSGQEEEVVRTGTGSATGARVATAIASCLASGVMTQLLERGAAMARRAVEDEVSFALQDLYDAGARWLRALLLARLAVPIAVLGWLAAMAALAGLLEPRFDWPLALLAVAGVNLCAAACLGGAARHTIRAGRRPREREVRSWSRR